MADSNAGKTYTSLAALIAGLTAKPPAAQMLVAGKATATPDLVTNLGTFFAPYKAADQASKVYDTALQERGKVEDQAVTVVAATTTALKGMFGPTSTALLDYGIKPDKVPTPLTTEQLVARKAKSQATRAARHTMGSKQKKAIKGEVPPAVPPPIVPTPKTP